MRTLDRREESTIGNKCHLWLDLFGRLFLAVRNVHDVFHRP